MIAAYYPIIRPSPIAIQLPMQFPGLSRELLLFDPPCLHPEGLRQLALAVVARAMVEAASQAKDRAARAAREEARTWLLTDGAIWFEGAGLGGQVDLEDIEAWLLGGCDHGNATKEHESKRKMTESDGKRGETGENGPDMQR